MYFALLWLGPEQKPKPKPVSVGLMPRGRYCRCFSYASLRGWSCVWRGSGFHRPRSDQGQGELFTAEGYQKFWLTLSTILAGVRRQTTLEW